MPMIGTSGGFDDGATRAIAAIGAAPAMMIGAARATIFDAIARA